MGSLTLEKSEFLQYMQVVVVLGKYSLDIMRFTTRSAKGSRDPETTFPFCFSCPTSSQRRAGNDRRNVQACFES